MKNLLEVENLSISFDTGNGWFKAVDGISFGVAAGKIACIVGQSGSGKSLTALSIINMVPPSGKIEGRILFKEQDLLALPPYKMAQIRGRHIFSIFQNPMNSLNRSITTGKQLFEMAVSHGAQDKGKFYRDMGKILERMNFSNPYSVLRKYPFQLSGGMLQRMVIAFAVYSKPELIIADEPTTALDVTVQKEILRQFREIRDQWGATILLITHDFGVVAEIADDVIVMKEGRIVEKNGVRQIFNYPRDAYTKALIKATFDKEVDQTC
ncbi:MAG: ABC transporter ATP-binding protein [Clostridiales bacterium]|jgi:ABC-type dipeptide/oligopeptide/nickel transport system ATPase component|nr:ABC transporter ATP-binding protein [Eubacteriales bacterium]MDH7566188.1 ABC transporter ATP-binding protein [Clostridiales bacterium]